MSLVRGVLGGTMPAQQLCRLRGCGAYRDPTKYNLTLLMLQHHFTTLGQLKSSFSPHRPPDPKTMVWEPQPPPRWPLPQAQYSPPPATRHAMHTYNTACDVQAAGMALQAVLALPPPPPSVPSSPPPTHMPQCRTFIWLAAVTLAIGEVPCGHQNNWGPINSIA